MTLNLNADDFAIFGLPPVFSLDLQVLAQRWKDLQSQVHPDKFSTQDLSSQRLAMQWAVRINEAHARLKDPVQRAAYLCQLKGQDVQAHSNTQMPAAFLMQQMDWREALDAANSPEAVMALQDEVLDFRRQALDQLAHTLDMQADFEQGVAQVRALLFVDRFMQDISKRFDVMDH